MKKEYTRNYCPYCKCQDISHYDRMQYSYCKKDSSHMFSEHQIEANALMEVEEENEK
jgi:hypothetical protein